MSEYLEKYLKYKNKYLKLKNISGGSKFGSNKLSFSNKKNKPSSRKTEGEGRSNLLLQEQQQQRQKNYELSIKKDLQPLDEYFKKLEHYYNFKLNQGIIREGFNEFKKKYDDEKKKHTIYNNKQESIKEEYEKCIKIKYVTKYGCVKDDPFRYYIYTFKEFLKNMTKFQDKNYDFINYVKDDETLQTFIEIKDKIGEPPTIPTNLTKKVVTNDVKIITFEDEIEDYNKFKNNNIISNENYEQVAKFIKTILRQYILVPAT